MRIPIGVDPYTGREFTVSHEFLAITHTDACPICRAVRDSARALRDSVDPDRTLPPGGPDDHDLRR